VTSSLAVFGAATRVKSTHLIESCFKNRKKYGRNFYTNQHLKVRLDIEFTAFYGEVTPEEALTSFTVYIWCISLVCASGRVIVKSESRSRIEYLTPMNNIIVLDLYFNLMNKSNLIDRL